MAKASQKQVIAVMAVTKKNEEMLVTLADGTQVKALVPVERRYVLNTYTSEKAFTQAWWGRGHMTWINKVTFSGRLVEYFPGEKSCETIEKEYLFCKVAQLSNEK